ncbi:MazG-like family protein [Solibacillus isronensis]|uniref:MazG-like family protein n=1 Tax=Solibacillus isronensis TaxID=412383 RepID=UPI0039A2F407
MNELIKQVEQWSINKGLDKAESSKQFLKVTEEVGEVAAALARNDKDALRDGIGDVVVTLIILAQQNGMDLEECLNCAYDEIKGRTGEMVNGVFVKSADLIVDTK